MPTNDSAYCNISVTYFNAQNVLILNAYLKQPLFDFCELTQNAAYPIIPCSYIFWTICIVVGW